MEIHLEIGTRKGYAIGGKANVVPQEYINANLIKCSVDDFNRVIDRTSAAKLMNMAPAYVRVTEKDTLIIENV